MASAFSHAVVAIAVGAGLASPKTNWKLILLGAFGTIVPDGDALGYFYGVPYASPWGHRGFTHSFVFALFFALLMTVIFFRQVSWQKKTGVLLFLFFCTASHAVLDAMTDAGKGVAFFWPWDFKRYFFEFRPITASPMSPTRFFTVRGWIVLKNELLWIWLPSLAGFVVLRLAKTICRSR